MTSKSYMRKLLTLLLALFTVSCASEHPTIAVNLHPATSTSATPKVAASVPAARTADWPDERLTKEIATILQDYRQLQPGMTRAQLTRFFTGEGGISDTRHRTYVHRACLLIKVDVDFEPVPGQSGIEEQPSDIITKISAPYLGYMVMD